MPEFGSCWFHSPSSVTSATRWRFTWDGMLAAADGVSDGLRYRAALLDPITRASLGIDVEIRSQDTAAFLKRVYTDNDFDVTSNFFYALPDPTIGVQRIYWTKNIKKGVPFSNASGYSNPEMDKVIEDAQIEHDRKKRKGHGGARPPGAHAKPVTYRGAPAAQH